MCVCLFICVHLGVFKFVLFCMSVCGSLSLFGHVCLCILANSFN